LIDSTFGNGPGNFYPFQTGSVGSSFVVLSPIEIGQLVYPCFARRFEMFIRAPPRSHYPLGAKGGVTAITQQLFLVALQSDIFPAATHGA
jgi:hypothetical protein